LDVVAHVTIPALRRLRQEDHKALAILGPIVRVHLKKERKKKNRKEKENTGLKNQRN
jgi:hypothetical protein